MKSATSRTREKFLAFESWFFTRAFSSEFLVDSIFIYPTFKNNPNVKRSLAKD